MEMIPDAVWSSE